MNNPDEYDAQAGTIKISDITSNKHNKRILCQLKNNNPDPDAWFIIRNWPQVKNDTYYYPENAQAMGWLGKYIGENTHI